MLNTPTSRFLSHVTEALDDLFGDALVGVYPFGSIAFGDYVPSEPW